MPREIEYKFLIDSSEIVLPQTGEKIVQGYLPMSVDVNTVVRIRIKAHDAYLAIKGQNTGAVRAEYEYTIPVDEAEEILQTLCQKPFIEKTRYEVVLGLHTWEIDVFHGDNQGLVIAELEVSDEQEEFSIPDWVRQDVTHDSRYYNSNLLINPFKNWS